MITQLVKEKYLPWLSYPLVIASAIFLHAMMVEREISLSLSTYVPVILGAIAITVLEWVIPFRSDWRPFREDVKNDLIYMTLVQIVLPRLLSFAVALLMLRYVQEENLGLIDIWVHEWPIAIQVVLMIVCAEFLRYWVHRLAHTWSPLWRLHAVHHSPDKLYWLNTGRFHPLEKALQFLFDALPFILMGVGAEVLALYFVFYALNGFFQHSNINLKFGLLNYLISTAELHRWHHSRDIKESGTNYGNNVIIWDLVFGSWFLPRERKVEDLGLINIQYPMNFNEQLKTPFTAGIDKHETQLVDVNTFTSNIKTQVGIFFANWMYLRPLIRSLHDPMKCQENVLLKIVQDNRETDYGKDFHFRDINNSDDFVRCVPIQDYESFRPYIEKQELEKSSSLTCEQPHFYAQTSGTTGKPKHIPVTQDTLKQHQRSLAIFACVQNQVQKNSFSGSLLTIPGPYDEGKLPGGTTLGSISGLLYREMPTYLKNKYAVPEIVFGIKDHELKYRLILLLALQHKNLTYLVSANPSTFLKLAEILNAELISLANDIEHGTFSLQEDLPVGIRETIDRHLIADRKRAEELRTFANRFTSTIFADVWPNLQLLVTWTGGSCGVAVSSIKPMLPSHTKILELGYLSSELRVSITLPDTGNAGIPTFHDNYYEFVETDLYDEGLRDTHRLDELIEGKQYYIIVTTSAGLFRYFMNDIVEVTGFKYRTPLLRFVQKGKGVTNITGEKLTESQLVDAVEKTKDKYQLNISFYLALAYVEQSRYEIFIEKPKDQNIDSSILAETIDSLLRKGNLEYDSKRSSQRLGALQVSLLEAGAGEAYKNHCLKKGQRESQFKAALLQYRSDIDFRFEQYCAGRKSSTTH